MPTSVVKGPDGAYYVGQLTGFPFPPGGANVWRVKPGHDPEVFKGGFTNIIDIAFDKRRPPVRARDRHRRAAQHP